MKKIMVIGAGMLQSYVIKRAKELGYIVICVDKNENSEGFKYADYYSAIDIVDKDSCLRYAQEMKIDGVLTAATDYGVLTASYIAKKMGLNGIDYNVAQIIKNKYRTRKVLSEKKVDDIGQFFEVSHIYDIEKIKEKIKFPIMVKPCDGSGSKGASRVDNIHMLEEACSMAIEDSITRRAIIESFITGNEYGVESFVYNGEIHILGIIEKKMTRHPYYAELGHNIPNRLNVKLENKVREVVKNAISALEVNFGSINMDLLVTSKGEVVIVDIGARMGGNLIGSHIIPLGTGINYIDNLIKATVGDNFSFISSREKISIVTRLLALKPGKVIGIPDFREIENKYNVKIVTNLKIGDCIREYHNNLDGCGYIISVSESLLEAEKQADEAKEYIDLNIKRN